MNTKKPWQSRTLVLNAIVGLAAFASLFLPAATGVAGYLSGHAGEIGSLWALANIVLRAITKDKIQLSD